VITPVEELIVNPAGVAENVPPVEPVIITLCISADLQKVVPE
jgi:hypothetical protein